MADDRDQLWQLLSEGLDLCVRARQMDAMDRRNAGMALSDDPQGWQESGNFDRYVTRNNVVDPDRPIATRSGTIALWVQEQYDRDLADWERRSRKHLQQFPA